MSNQEDNLNNTMNILKDDDDGNDNVDDGDDGDEVSPPDGSDENSAEELQTNNSNSNNNNNDNQEEKNQDQPKPTNDDKDKDKIPERRSTKKSMNEERSSTHQKNTSESNQDTKDSPENGEGEGEEDDSQNDAIKPNEQPKKIMDPEFYYEIHEYLAGPMISEDSGIPENLLTIYHQFGMDASRRENLQLLENSVLCHIFGNYLQIMNTETREKLLIRSISGVGIGAFSVHPKHNYIAIAEKGTLPFVCIYQYPEIRLYRILKEGTQTAYSACQFSPDGEMIATVGCDPDYMLTLWEWRNEQIVLRAKAFSQDIYRVAWSTDLSGVLTTAGVGHIRFWKMAHTFTGLKLQGKLGKFGKVELTDIEGFVTLPDGKVLTGSAWGNLLVWDGELIKVQISRKGKRPCHNGYIMQIVMDEGELMTIGQDGWIRTWDFETVDTAECSEEGALYELEPMNELRVGTKARLTYIVKIPIPDSTMWYAQDSDGAIWKLDLSFSHTSLAPELLDEFHANDIVDCVTSPLTYCAATVGLDGKVCIYDIVQKQVIVERRFPSSGSTIIWSPPQVDPKGKILVVGHQDGVLRLLKFGENPEEPSKRTKDFALLDLGQALKPHKMAITSMIYSPSGRIFITGSKDETLFFFNVHSTHLSPIGFVHVHEKVVRLEWYYVNNKPTNEVIVYLENGCVITIECPSENQIYDHSKTFALSQFQTTHSYQLLSIKSRLEHDEESEVKLERYEKEKEMRQEIRRMNARLQPETEEDKQKLDDEEELIRQGVMSEIADWAPTYPTSPSPLLYGCLDRNEPNHIWMSLGEFDKGYLYKCKLGGPVLTIDEAVEKVRKEKANIKKQNQIKHDMESGQTEVDQSSATTTTTATTTATTTITTDTNNTEHINKKGTHEIIDPQSITLADRIPVTEPNKAVRMSEKKDTCVTYWTFSQSGYRVLIGYDDGVIRVQLLEKAYDLTSFKGYWIFRLHDNQRGRVNRIALTYDEKFVLSAASDGTLFVCELMTEELQDKEMKEYRARIPSTFDTSVKVDDITDPKAYSIEEYKQKSEYDRLIEQAEQKKAETRLKVAELRRRFKKLKDRNERLPERIRLPTSWEELQAMKPPDDYEDPKDVEAIRLAQEQMGDYKLKSATNYVIPESMKLNTFGAKYRLLSIVDKTFELRHEFNASLLNLRDKKMMILEELKRIDGQLEKVNCDLPVEEIGIRLHLEELDIEEYPEKKYTYDNEILMEFKKKLEKEGTKIQAEKNYHQGGEPTTTTTAVKKSSGTKVSFTDSILPSERSLRTEPDMTSDFCESEQIVKSIVWFPLHYLTVNTYQLFPNDYPGKLFSLIKYYSQYKTFNEISVCQVNDNVILDDHPIDQQQQQQLQQQQQSQDGNNLIKICLSRPIRPDKVNSCHIQKFEADLIDKTDMTDKMEYKTFNEISVCQVNDNVILDDHPIDQQQQQQQLQQQQHSQDGNNLIKICLSRPIRPDKVNSCHIQKFEADLIDKTDMTDKMEVISLMSDLETNPSEGSYIPRGIRPRKTITINNVETELQKQRYIRAKYERDMLLATASRLVRCFDAELRLLRHARFKLDVLLKRADLHQLTLYDEFRLLKEFEKSEHVLTEKKQSRSEEKHEINQKVNEVTAKIEQKKKELERLAQREHQIHEEFKANISDSHKFAEFLTKVFKKRIKRKKQEVFHSDESQSEESSSSDESSFDESEDESGTEDVAIMDLDTCPPGCPVEDFEHTCLIREKRLDIEEEMAEEKKALELLRKDLETFTKKQRVIEAALKQAQSELEAFQLEKQRKLNELEIIVILRLDQIHHYTNYSVPSDMTGSLIFLRHTLHALRRRIKELEEEKKHQRVERKQAKARHAMLQKHKRLFQKELEKLSAICDKEMNDKFGRIDDIEKMENVMVNPKLEDLTTKMLILQEEFNKEEAKIEAKIRMARDDCMGQVRQNTVYLTQLLMLFNEHQQLQNELNHTQGSKIGAMHNSSGYVDAKQLKQLVQLAKLQSEEIHALTKEIQQLSR
ncbi:unnamed protein product [Trichobilharzia szidati]|nr:unnamed protein product [Trichobilharzia szidati]